jgi:cytochrome b561
MIQSSQPLRRWTRTARLLHWGTALAILVEVPVGFAMAWSYGPAMKGGAAAELHLRTSQIHHTVGLTLLAAVFFRLWWRLRHPAPDLPASVAPVPAITARMVQALLYGLLVALPLTGWAALSSMAAGAGYAAPPLWFFTHDGFGPGGLIPRIVASKPWDAPGLMTYGTFARAHVWLVWTGGALLAAHVAGALYHHFVRKDGVLARMLSDRQS